MMKKGQYSDKQIEDIYKVAERISEAFEEQNIITATAIESMMYLIIRRMHSLNIHTPDFISWVVERWELYKDSVEEDEE